MTHFTLVSRNVKHAPTHTHSRPKGQISELAQRVVDARDGVFSFFLVFSFLCFISFIFVETRQWRQNSYNKTLQF